MAVLELHRVLDAEPEELDRHRLGLKAARDDRNGLIERATGQLLARMPSAVDRANAGVLLHPAKAPAVVQSSNIVVGQVEGFRQLLAIEATGSQAESRRWSDAASDVLGRVIDTGADGLGSLQQLGGRAVDQVSSAKDKLSGKINALRRKGSDDSGR